MGKETALPKNIRQIGDIRGREKICIEDYVMTYIRKKELEEEKGYLGIFLGEKKEMEDSDYIFIRGILEVPIKAEVKTEVQEEKQGKAQIGKEAEMQGKSQVGKETEAQGKLQADKEAEAQEETLAEKLQKERRLYFPEWEIQGCCVIGAYPTERMEELIHALPQSAAMLYHLQEQEENLYWMKQGQYQRIRGYFVFYEQNKLMQEYMSEVFGDKSVEKESQPDRAIRNFREKVAQKSEQKSKSMLKLASSFFVVTVLVIGAVVVNRLDDIRTIRQLSELEKEQQQLTQQEAQTFRDPAGHLSEEYTQEVEKIGVTEAEPAAVSKNAEQSYFLEGSTAFWEEEYEDVISDNVTQIETEVSGDAESTKIEEAIQGSLEEISAPVSTEYGEETERMEAEKTNVPVNAGIVDESAKAAEEIAAADQERESEASQEVSSLRQLSAAYVIKAGDTLADICSRYYGSLDRLEEICEVNEIADANRIMPGQKIVLP